MACRPKASGRRPARLSDSTRGVDSSPDGLLRRGDDAAPQLLDSLGSALDGYATRLVGTLTVPYPAQYSRRRPADGHVDPLVGRAVLNSEQPRPRTDLPGRAVG